MKSHSEWLAKAAYQHRVMEKVLPERGEIFWRSKDETLQLAATNKNFPIIYAVPKEIDRPEEISAILGKILGIQPEILYRKLSKADDPYEILMRKVPPETIQDIISLGIKGVYVGNERGRFYPGWKLGSHILGFVGANNAEELAGRYGLEAKYEDILRGKPLKFEGIRDAGGKIIFSLGDKTTEAGAKLILTIDPQIQFEAERLLGESVEKWRAKSGNIIVIEPKTGRLLAIANTPSFNPNEFPKEKNFEVFLNQSVSSRYEPGSVFKPFTMAAGLETGSIKPETTYYDSGQVRIGPHIIKNAGDSAPGREITMTRVLERSYNVGAVFVAMKTGASFMRDFLLNRFKFEEKVTIDLPSEIKSDFKNLKPPEGKEINFATASFGQGIAVTPIKLAQAFAAFANGGKLMRPYLVEEIHWPGGNQVEVKPQEMGQAVSQETIEKLLPMLEAVVQGEYGSGKLARIPGYRLAGKTGTGEIPYENYRGYSERINHTFVGFGPTNDPRILILVRLEEPVGARYAEATAVPVFRDLMNFILQYYEIPPNEELRIKN